MARTTRSSLPDRLPIAGSERPPSREARLIGKLDPVTPVGITIVVRRCPDAPPPSGLEALSKTPLGALARSPLSISPGTTAPRRTT